MSPDPLSGAGMTEETGAVDTAAVETEVSLEDALGAAYDRMTVQNGADRGEDGRFRSTKDDAADKAPEGKSEDEPPAAEEDAPAGEHGEAGEEDAPDPDVAPAPAHMPQAIKDRWAKLDPETRDAIAAHQRDIDRKFSEQGRQLQATRPLYERLTQAVREHPEFAQMTPQELADGAMNLAAVQARLARDPVNTIIDVAKQYGALEHVRAALSNQQPTDQQNYVANLHHQIQQLTQQIARLGDPNAIEDRISARFSERETASVVEQFKASAPLFADVEPMLPHFIGIARENAPEAAPADVLKAAYDMAIHAIPEVRAKIEATGKAASKPDPERAAKAKKATTVNVKSTSAGKERTRSEHELLSDVYDRLMAG